MFVKPEDLQELAGLGGRPFDGVLRLDEWETLDRAGFSATFVDFGARSQVIAHVRSHLRARSGPNVLHLAGLSGIGKTRTVLEACRDQRDLSGVLYLQRRADLQEQLLRYLTRSPNLLALVVVDEVPLEDLRSLVSQVEAFSQRLRFVTIGPARRSDPNRPSANILVLPEPDTEEGVLRVVRSAGAGIPEPVLQSIAKFAAHDLRLAFMLIEATRQDGSLRDLPIQDGEDVWRRVISLFRTRLGNSDAFQSHYPYLTVAIDIGIRGEFRSELEDVAQEFGIAVQRLDEAIDLAAPCGLGFKTANFFEPAPRALAGHLFRQRIWGPLQPRLAAFLRKVPDRLLRRFVERCQECVGPDREEMENALAFFFREELGLPRMSRLFERGPSRLFKAWAELDPKRGLDWLQQATAAASDEELRAFDGKPDGSGGWRGRRQVVWLCEELSPFGEYFWNCASILFRLAQVETETAIGNNSTEIWKSMFLAMPSFTEVAFPDRANHLLRRLSQSNEATLKLTFSALLQAIDLGSGLRPLPPAVVGGRVLPEPWRPTGPGQLYGLQSNLAEKALATIGALRPQLLTAARQLVVNDLASFSRLGLVSELRELLDSGGEEVRRSLRPQLKQVIDLRQGANERRNHETHDPVSEALRAWQEDLRPQCLAERVQQLTSLDYWEANKELRSSGTAETATASSARLVVEEVLHEPEIMQQLADWFESDKAPSAFGFAAALGEADRTGALILVISSWLKESRCRRIVAGYLQGAGRLHGALSSEWSKELDQVADKNAEYAGVVTIDADISISGYHRIMQMVGAGSLPSRALTAFGLPAWEPLIGIRQRSDILELLLRLQQRDAATALGAALSLGQRWTSFGKEPLAPELAESMIAILAASLNLRVDPYAWSNLLFSLAESHPKEVAELAADALTSVSPLRVSLGNLILPPLLELARSHPRIVMEAVGRRLLDPDRRSFFGLLSFPGLFEAIGIAELQRWLEEHGTEHLRLIARHLMSPQLRDGTPWIPNVTDWALTEFAEDDRVFREFCSSRHAFEAVWGHARDRRAELEKTLEPFRENERLWVQYELDQNKHESELDDQFHDQFERT